MIEKYSSVSVMYKIMLFLIALFSLRCQNKKETPEPLIMRKANDSFKLTEIEEIHLQGDSSRVIGMVTSFKIADNGDIYLNDESSSTIHVYSSRGKFLHQIGRFGQGPGEFEHNRTIRLDKDKVGVMDVRGHKITFFDFKANYLKDLRFSKFPEILVLGDQFDLSSNGSRIYVNCIETNVKPDKVCEKSFIIAAFDEKLNLVSLGGKMDPIIQSYCGKFLPDAFIRTDRYGNIYVVHQRLPRITKYTSAFQKLKVFNFYTKAWKHPYVNLNADISFIDLESISHSEVFEIEISKATGRIFICHARREVNQSKHKTVFPYLSVLSADDELLISAQEIPLSPMAINNEEDVFFIKDYTSTGCIIGKYRLIPLK